MTAPDTAKPTLLQRLRASWEYKSIAFLLRAVVALIVIAYIALTAPFIWPWAQSAYARLQPPQAFEALLDTAIKTDNYAWADRWLKSRPRSETPVHVAVLERNIESIPALLIWPLAQNARQKGDAEDIRFWLMYTQYRLRFDVIRCGIADLEKDVSNFNALTALLHGPDGEMAEVGNDPQKMAALLQKILDYDAQHPARNSPLYTCSLLGRLRQGSTIAILPQEGWATIRHTLRAVTEMAIASMKAGHAPGPISASPFSAPADASTPPDPDSQAAP